jgi:putative N6-adenine-specific DNA methylase
MCGSGVIPIEMAMIAHGVIPGVRRKFAFEDYPGFRGKAFSFMKNKLKEEIKKHASKINIYASDINEKAILTIDNNLINSGMSLYVKTRCIDFFSISQNDYEGENKLFISNPPYGERIKNQNINNFYRKLGDKLRSDFKGSSFAFIVHGLDAEKAFSMKYTKKIIFYNGGIPVSLLIGKC